MQINAIATEMLPGRTHTLLSSDWIHDDVAQQDAYTDEILNSINQSGFPIYKLELRINMPVILLRNYDKHRKLCNGTKLIVVKITKYLLTLRRAASPYDIVHLPRWNMYTSTNLPFTFGRRQFPVQVAFAFTIHKSQGQSLRRVALFLPCPVFAHGQLYVALSRATTPDGLKILLHTTSTQGYTNSGLLWTQNIVLDAILKFIA